MRVLRSVRHLVRARYSNLNSILWLGAIDDFVNLEEPQRRLGASHLAVAVHLQRQAKQPW